MTPTQMKKRATSQPSPNDIYHLWVELAEVKEYIEDLILRHRDHCHADGTGGNTGPSKGGPNAG